MTAARRYPRVTGTALARFWSKVDKSGGCWEWRAARHPSGYGLFGLRPFGNLYAHRVAYESMRYPIPDGMVLDHLCRNRGCVNPDHLEPVTARENTMRSPVASAAVKARQTHCIHGHALEGANLYITPSTGSRACRACSRRRKQERRAGAKLEAT